jgi:hypothetical protein
MIDSADYRLRNDVFLCLSGEHIVVLDLARDRYLAVDAAGTEWLASTIPGWPAKPQAARAATSAQPSDHEGVRELISAGLLTTDHRLGKEIAPIDIPRPRIEITADAYSEECSISAREAAVFLRATSTVALALKCLPLKRVVSLAQRRKRQALRRRPLNADLDKAAQLVTVFARLRPLAFTARNACLFESLALGRFLAAYGFVTSWVFGVQTVPFSAHAWLQIEDVVLNDTVEHTRQYTPIMSI